MTGPKVGFYWVTAWVLGGSERLMTWFDGGRYVTWDNRRFFAEEVKDVHPVTENHLVREEPETVPIEEARRQFVVYGGLAAHGFRATRVRETADGGLEVLDGSNTIGMFRKEAWGCWLVLTESPKEGAS